MRKRGMAMLMVAAAGLHGVNAGEQRYGGSLLESRWYLTDSPHTCTLTQEIPRLGRAVFYRDSDDSLRFALLTRLGPHKSGYARVVSIAPPWLHSQRSLELGRVRVQPGNAPIRQGANLAKRLFIELEKGRSIRFHYQDWTDGTDLVQVTLPAIRFQDATAQFSACGSRKPSPVTVYFATDSDELTQSAIVALDTGIPRFTNFPQAATMLVSGYADPRGSRTHNHALAKRRAERVGRYLIDGGISAERIQTRVDVSPSSDLPGDGLSLAQGRRVIVTLSEPPMTFRPSGEAGAGTEPLARAARASTTLLTD